MKNPNIVQLNFRTSLFSALLIVLSASGVFTQNAQPSVSPTPTPQPTATPAIAPIPLQTLADLQSKFRARLARPELRRGQVGIKITSLNSGKVVFEENAEKYFMPASNMKNFTVATAIEKLTPDFRFVTSVYAAAMPDSSGTIKGDLRIYGRGDVSISTSFSEGNYYKGLDELADKIIAAGVKRVEGSIVGDDSYFKGDALPGSWEWDDLQLYYAAEVSALPLNDNAVDLTVRPGPVGYPCTVKLSPYNLIYRVKNLCTTTASGSPETLKVVKLLGQNQLEITGTLPQGNAGFSRPVTVSKPSELFAALLKQRLEAKGVVVTGQYRAIVPSASTAVSQSVEIAKLESQPLSLIAAKTMKPSQNMYTETLLWTLGEHVRASSDFVSDASSDSWILGRSVVRKFLTDIGIPEDSVVMFDGSGLSRSNLITPSAVVSLYTYMAKRSSYANVWRDSLTIAGVDGTLRNRFAGTRAAGNVRGKTGTIRQVSSLSGYLTTAGGEPLVFSIIINGIPETSLQRPLIDEVVLSLANFNGKVD